MKKYLKLILIFFLVFSFKNVYAISLEVCSNCEFQTLDQALAYAEEDNNLNNYYDIILFDSGTFSFSRNYNMTASVSISGVSEYGNYVFNGNGHTINTINSFAFDAADTNLSVKNITFNIQDFYDLWHDDIFLYLYGNQVIIDDLSIVNKDGISYDDDYFVAVSIHSFSSAKITNTTISGFMIGFLLYGLDSLPEACRVDDGFYGNPIHSHHEVIQTAPPSSELLPVEMDSCDLYDTVFSVYSQYIDLEVSNTRLSSVEANYSNIVLNDNNDYGDAVIKMVDSNGSDPNFWDNIEMGSLNHQYIYLVDDFDYGESTSSFTVYVKKSESMNIATTKEASLLDCFIHIDSDEMNLYRFSVSDESIAKIEDGKIKFLKVGEVDVIATDISGNVSYTVHFRLDDPNAVKPSNNPKTINSLYIMFGLLILMFVISSSMIMKKRNI